MLGMTSRSGRNVGEIPTVKACVFGPKSDVTNGLDTRLFGLVRPVVIGEKWRLPKYLTPAVPHVFIGANYQHSNLFLFTSYSKEIPKMIP